jgi:hypothetical protein
MRPQRPPKSVRRVEERQGSNLQADLMRCSVVDPERECPRTSIPRALQENGVCKIRCPSAEVRFLALPARSQGQSLRPAQNRFDAFTGHLEMIGICAIAAVHSVALAQQQPAITVQVHN